MDALTGVIYSELAKGCLGWHVLVERRQEKAGGILTFP